MMKLKHPRILLGVLSAFLLLAVGFYFLMESEFMLERARRIMVSQIRKQLSADVSIGAVSGNLLRYAFIDGLVIKDARKEGEPVLSAASVLVDYRLTGLIRGKFLIRKVQLVSAQINLVLQENGRINLADILPERPPHPGKVSIPNLLFSNIIIKDSAVSIDDRLHGVSTAVSGITLVIQGDLIGRRYGGNLRIADGFVMIGDEKREISDFQIEFEVKGKNLLGIATNPEITISELRAVMGNSSVRLSGSISDLRKVAFDGTCDMSLRIADFLPAIRKFSDSPMLADAEGAISVSVAATGDISKLHGTGKIIMSNVKARGIDVDRAEINAEFTEKTVSLDIDSKVNGGAVKSPLYLKLQDGKPHVKGFFGISNVRLPEMQIAEGILNGRVMISGSSVETLSVNSEFDSDQLRIKNTEVSPFRMKAVMKEGNLTGNVAIPGAQIAISAGLQETDRGITIDGKAEITSEDVKTIGGVLGIREVTGIGVADIRMSGDLFNPTLEVNGGIRETTYQGFPFGEVEFALKGGFDRMQLLKLDARYKTLQASVTGEIRSLLRVPSVDYKITYSGVPLRDYVQVVVPDIDLDGTADGTGTMHGRVDAFDGGISINVSRLNLYNIPFDTDRIDVAFKSARIVSPRVEFRSDAGSIWIEVEVLPDGKSTVTGEIGPLKLDRLLAHQGFPDLFGGDVSSNFVAHGFPDKSSDFNGKIMITGLNYKGELVGDVMIDVSGLNEDFTLELSGIGGSLSGNAAYNRTKKLDLTLEIDRMMLDPYLPKPFTGELSASIVASLSAPELALRDSSVLLTSFSLKSPTGQIRLQGTSKITANSERISVDNLVMNQGRNGNLIVSGYLGKGQSNLVMNIDRVDVGMFLPDLAGEIGLNLRITGDMFSPELEISGISDSISLVRRRSVRVEDIQWSLLANGNRIEIERLTASPVGGKFEADGEIPVTVDLRRGVFRLADREIRVRFSGEFDPRELGEFLGTVAHPDSGRILLNGQFTGSSRAPRMSADIRTQSISVTSPRFPQIDLSIDGRTSLIFDLAHAAAEIHLDESISADKLNANGKLEGSITARWAGLTDIIDPSRLPMIDYDLSIAIPSASAAGVLPDLMDGKNPVTDVSIADLKAHLTGNGFDIEDMNANIRLDVGISIGDHRVRSVKPVELRFGEDKAQFNDIRLSGENSSINIDGWITGAGEFEIAAGVRLPVKAFSRMIQREDIRSGEFRLDLTGKGSLDSPVLSARGDISNLAVGRIQFNPSISFTAGYSDDLLTIGRLYVRWGGRNNRDEIIASGKLPVRADLSEMRFALIDKPITASIQGNIPDLSFLRSLSESVTESIGAMSFNFEFLASRERIEPYGSLSLGVNRLGLRGLLSPVENLVVSVIADGSGIEVEPISMSIGRGRFTARAKLAIADDVGRSLVASGRFQKLRLEELADLSVEPYLNVSGIISGGAEMSADLSDLPLTDGNGISGLVRNLLSRGKGQVDIDEFSISMNGGESRITKPIKGVLSDGAFDLRSFRMKSDESQPAPIDLAAMMLWKIGESLSVDVAGRIGLGIFKELSELESSGDLGFNFSLRGNETNPKFEASWSIDNFKVRRAKFNSIGGKIAYADDRMMLTDVLISIGDNTVKANGSIPARLNLPGFRMTFPDEKMEISIDARLNSLSFIPLISPDVISAQGKGIVSLTIGRTLKKPSISGVADFQSLGFQYLPTPIDMKDTRLTAVFSDKRIIIDRMSGIINDGSYNVFGSIELEGLKPGNLDINGSWNSSVFSQPSLYIAKTSGDLSLKGTYDLPVLSGTILIDEFTYSQSWSRLLAEALTPIPETRAIVLFNFPFLRNMELDLEVQAPGKVNLNAGIVSVESKLSGTIRGSINGFVFIGESDIIAGQLVYLNHKFTITEGHIENVNRFRFNPRYVIVAETVTPIRGVTLVDMDGNTRIRDIEITMTLTGTLDEPAPPMLSARILNAEPGEDYELDMEDIISILTTGRTGLLTSAQMSDLSYTAAGIFRRRAESYLGGVVAGLFGFKEFEIELATSDIEETRLFFTKEFTPKWSLSYSSTLQLHSEPRVEVEYKLSDHLAITGERNEEGEYGLDLKLGFEFR